MVTQTLRLFLDARLPLAIAATALALSSPSPALASEACEEVCACPHFVPDLPDVPYPWHDHVPTNARLFVPVQPGGESTIVLYPESDPGAVVPVTIEEEAPGGRAVWVRPESELAPYTRYVLEVQSDAVAEKDQFKQSFSTDAAESDTKAPLPPEATTEPISDGATCDPLLGFVVVLNVDVPQAADLFQLVISTPDEPDQVVFASFYYDDEAGEKRIVIGDSQVEDSFCDVDNQLRAVGPSLPGAALGQSVTVTITEFDIAGNASSPTVLSNVPIRLAEAGEPEMQGACCGCSSAGVDAAPAGLGVVPLGALAVLLRRRRRSAARAASSAAR